MPELPEVETIARQLRTRLLQRHFDAVEILWARTVERPSPAEFVHELLKASVLEVGRRGKFLSFNLNTGKTWLVHLRMTGKFRIQEAGTPAKDDLHTRARFLLDDGTRLDYVDPRKFGRFYLVENSHIITGALGPEPLSPEFTTTWLSTALQSHRGEIKRLLLDQNFLAGLGNIYVNEALWRAGIHPLRAAQTLTEAEATCLHGTIVSVLREGVEHGGATLSDRQYVYPDGSSGQQQLHLAVYDRAGERCPRCGYSLERIVQAQRSTYFCPICQPCSPCSHPGDG